MPRKTQSFKIVPDEDDLGEPRKLFADDRVGRRIEVKPGAEFTAALEQDFSLAKVFADGRMIPAEPLDRWSVVSSDIGIANGCLTSLIRTGQAVPTGPAKELA